MTTSKEADGERPSDIDGTIDLDKPLEPQVAEKVASEIADMANEAVHQDHLEETKKIIEGDPDAAKPGGVVEAVDVAVDETKRAVANDVFVRKPREERPGFLLDGDPLSLDFQKWPAVDSLPETTNRVRFWNDRFGVRVSRDSEGNVCVEDVVELPRHTAERSLVINLVCRKDRNDAVNVKQLVDWLPGDVGLMFAGDTVSEIEGAGGREFSQIPVVDIRAETRRFDELCGNGFVSVLAAIGCKLDYDESLELFHCLAIAFGWLVKDEAADQISTPPVPLAQVAAKVAEETNPVISDEWLAAKMRQAQASGRYLLMIARVEDGKIETDYQMENFPRGDIVPALDQLKRQMAGEIVGPEVVKLVEAEPPAIVKVEDLLADK